MACGIVTVHEYVIFPTSNIRYSRVCGRIMVALMHLESEQAPVLTLHNVDGVSLTYGNPRQHIWTFAAALDQSVYNDSSSYCPCINSTLQNINPPSFVGDDYFCDTGMDMNDRYSWPRDPMWDGAGCGSRNTCCDFNTPPWFYKQLPDPTTDDIEMRACRDEIRDNENIAIVIIEIFVQ